MLWFSIAVPCKTSPKAITLEDMVKMFESVSGDEPQNIRDRAILAMLTDTGARAAGIVTLEYADLDIERRRAVVNEKGAKRRVVVFSEFTAEILRQWVEIRISTRATVFYNFTSGKPLTVSGLYQICQRIAIKAGVSGRFNPHSFRHGFAREYLLSGGDFATLSRLMGHTDVSITASFYAVFSDDELAKQHEKHSPTRILQKSKRRTDVH